MTPVTLSLTLPSHLVGALQNLAQEHGDALDTLARGMLEREVMHLKSTRVTRRALSARHARLRDLLAPEIAAAPSWGVLQSRLALYGVTLKGSADLPMLHDLITGEWLCPLSSLGVETTALSERIGAPFPAAQATSAA